MKPPFGELPKAEPRFRRPVASAAKRRVLKSLLHMSFLFVWIMIMLICTPAGSWLFHLFWD